MRALDVRRLRILLGALLLALALPAAVLMLQARRQMATESFQQQRALAFAFAEQVDADLQRAIAIEEGRSYADYRYFVAGVGAKDAYVQRSALAQLPVATALPAPVGHFQIDADGTFSTPLLPDDAAQDTDLLPAERQQRAAVRDRLFELLTRNRLLADAPHAAQKKERRADADAEQDRDAPANAAAAEIAQRAFDELNAPAAQTRAKTTRLGRVAELKLEQNYADPQSLAASADVRGEQQRAARTEQGMELAKQSTAVQLFESDVDPFEFGLLESGHVVLFRKVWRDGRRTIQGALFEQDAFLRDAIVAPFQRSALGERGDLAIAYRGDVVLAQRAGAAHPAVASDAIEGELLHRARLAAPFDGLELIVAMRALPPGPGARIVAWSSAALAAVLLLAFAALYRLGLRQIALVQQQRNFVAAVSHELKTPLTSIRMYAEMLREGWAADARKPEYYAFILDESERLSRLIANVLQLARLERDDAGLERRPVKVGTLLDLARSKLQAVVERAGFASAWEIDADCAGRELDVDADAVLQILINLVDNALKFAAIAERRELVIAAAARGERGVVLSVRDFGPGMPQAALQRVFELFYRGGDELTRATPGTGIGLALVRQLARAMNGDVEACNRDPGLEVRITFHALA